MASSPEATSSAVTIAPSSFALTAGAAQAFAVPPLATGWRVGGIPGGAADPFVSTVAYQFELPSSPVVDRYTGEALLVLHNSGEFIPFPAAGGFIHVFPTTPASGELIWTTTAEELSHRDGIIGSDSDMLIDPRLVSSVVVQFESLTDDHVYRLNVPSPSDSGLELSVTSYDTGHIITLAATGASDLANLAGPLGYSRPRSVRVTAADGAWYVIDSTF